jgi:hypothetical protein
MSTTNGKIGRATGAKAWNERRKVKPLTQEEKNRPVVVHPLPEQKPTIVKHNPERGLPTDARTTPGAVEKAAPVTLAVTSCRASECHTGPRHDEYPACVQDVALWQTKVLRQFTEAIRLEAKLLTSAGVLTIREQDNLAWEFGNKLQKLQHSMIVYAQFVQAV